MSNSRLAFHTASNLLAATLLLAASCVPRYYAPNQPNVPLFREKGEVQFSVIGSEGQEVSTLELQGAYALTDKVGVMMNADFANRNDPSHGFIVEGGAGYYRPFRRRFIFESYGGAGIGKAVNSFGANFLANP